MNLFASPLEPSPLVGRGRELATLRPQLKAALAEMKEALKKKDR